MASRTGNLLTDNLPLMTITVLGLIVLGSLLFGPFQGALELVAQDLSRILFGAAYAEAALNSAEAVSYAASCTALANLNRDGAEPDELKEAWQRPATPNVTASCNQSVTGEPVTFGQVSVQCDALSEEGSCTIRGLKLPQNVPDVGWGTWIAGMGHPEYLLYYEAFPNGPDTNWEIHAERLGAIAVATGALLNVAFYGVASKLGGGSGGLRGRIDNFLSSSDEGSSMIARARKLSRSLSPWSQYSTATDDIARNVISADIVRATQRYTGTSAIDDIADPNLRQAADNLHTYFQRNSLREEPLDVIRNDVKDQMRGHVDPGQIAAMSSDEFNDVANIVALNLKRADEVRAGAPVNTGGDTVQMSMRQYWQTKQTMDDVVGGLFQGSQNRLAREQVDTFVSQTRSQIDDFVSLPSFTLRGVSKNDIRRRAMALGCRSRIPRIVAHDAAESYFADNEDAQAIADALYVGSLSVSSICPGSDVMNRQQLRGWGSGAVKGFAGLMIAGGWASQKYFSDTQMHQPQGINTVAVKIPFVAPKRYKMHPYTNYYFMNLRKDDFLQSNNKNFYLVSPFTTRKSELDTEDPRISVTSTTVKCKKGGREGTYRLRTQADWNNGQPNVGSSGACEGSFDSSQSCGGRDTGRRRCQRLPGCNYQSWGRAGGTCAGELSVSSCSEISDQDTCQLMDDCNWDTVSDSRSKPFPADDWSNYIHVQDPVDPNQKDTLSGQVLSADANGKKVCATPPLVDLTFWDDDSYSVETIEIGVEDMTWQTVNGEPNYGYDSGDWDAAALKAGVVVLGIGLELASGPVPTTLVLAGAGAAEVVIFEGVDKANAWPEH